QAGVYDCRWATDTIRVVVAGELPREVHNAPLHLFSASPELVDFGSGTYQRRSESTSALLEQLFERLEREDLTMTYTMADFQRDYIKEHFPRLTPEQQDYVLQSLPPERRLSGLSTEQILSGLSAEQILSGLSAEQIRQYLELLTAERPAAPRKRRRKK
ncbi:MAG: hypothetical protein ACRELG_01090, partial [Gemmataceae bacterium]